MTDIQKEILTAIEEVALETHMAIGEVTKQAIELLKETSEENYLDI